MNDKRRLILAGGGHAHLEVLRRLAKRPLSAEVLLISAYPQHHYSGMVPGFLAGMYREDEISFDLQTLADRAGAQFDCDVVTSCDPDAGVIRTSRGAEYPYDWASFNIGSHAAGADHPRVREHAQRVKPISRAVQLRQRATELAVGSRGGSAPLSVVGAGSAGFEVALALERLGRANGGRFDITLWESGRIILPGYPERLRRKGEKILSRRGIKVETGVQVEAVEPDAVLTPGGRRCPSRLTVWLTGAAAPPLFREAGLPVDERGFLLVDSHLQSTSGKPIFGAGDCVTPASHRDTPKAGVFAVREAPLLWQNLQAAISGSGPSASFQPQAGFLSILNTCDQRALLDYHGWVSYSRWAWWLKNWIDQGFVRRYR